MSIAIIYYPPIKTHTKAALKAVIRYSTQKSKTDSTLISGKDLSPESAFDEMIAFKKAYGKEHGRQYIHVIQSFSPTDKTTSKQVHELGRQLADYYKGFQVLISTHTDRGHLHNHLIINSVSFENGLKFQQGPGEMVKVQQYSDRLCRAAGLSVIEKENKKTKALTTGEYRAALKGDSWKFKLISTIDKAMAASLSKKEFITAMEKMGYSVNWNDNHKHITYTAPNGMKCRDNKLHEEKYLKDRMEEYFEFRQFEDAETSGSGWKHQLAGNIAECVKKSASKEEFKYYLEKFGVHAAFSKDRISFLLADGKKCGSDKLLPYGDFTRDNIKKYLKYNNTVLELGFSDPMVMYHSVELASKLLNYDRCDYLKDKYLSGAPLSALEGQALREAIIEIKSRGLDWSPKNNRPENPKHPGQPCLLMTINELLEMALEEKYREEMQRQFENSRNRYDEEQNEEGYEL